MTELKRFFDSIKFVPQNDVFNTATINKVVINKKTETFLVYIESENVLPKEDVDALIKATANKINGLKEVNVTFIYHNITDDDIFTYFKDYLSNLIKKRPSLISLTDAKIKVENQVITVEVANKIEELEVIKETENIISSLSKYGFSNLTIKTFLNKKLEEDIKKSMENSAPAPIAIPEEKTNIIFGKHIDGEVENIDNILGDTKNIIVEAYVFGIDSMERENINIATLKISDKTNSIIAKIFKRDIDEYHDILKKIKVGSWYRFHGNAEFDNFSKDIVIAIRNMEAINSKDQKAVDDASEKRVELHAHTFMSMMDSVVPQKGLINYALSLGHKAVAVTDHNCLQAYPDLYHAVCDYNKGKDEKDHFKVLYGAELSVVNDDVDVIFNESNLCGI